MLPLKYEDVWANGAKGITEISPFSDIRVLYKSFDTVISYVITVYPQIIARINILSINLNYYINKKVANYFYDTQAGIRPNFYINYFYSNKVYSTKQNIKSSSCDC